jgi:hypothetical protein
LYNLAAWVLCLTLAAFSIGGNMQRYRDIAIIVLCAVLALCAWSVTTSVNRLSLAGTEAIDGAKADEGSLSVQMADQIDRIGSQTQQTLAEVSKATGTANGLMAVTGHRLNDLCDPGPCGVLPDVARTLATARGTMGQVEEASIQFNRHSATFYDQEAASSADLQRTVLDVDRFVTAPDLVATMHNFNAASLAVAGSAQNLDAATTDGRTWLHQKLFPTKKRGLVSGIEATGDVVHHWLPPLF